MFSKFRTLLVAGAIHPLATGFAFAQSAQPTTAPVANPPAVSATTSATAPTKTSKELGALKATPAEKKATHEKTSAATPSGKTAAVKTTALAPKHHVVKKPVVTAPKSDDAAAKKL
jgi:cytoskeletal protein RodZ